MNNKTAEHTRLEESRSRGADWKNWGPYVSERAWGTVREDYSTDGNAWDFFPHAHSRSRAYRWNEDGLAGFCNRFQNLCLGLALWNEKDPILKERLFGLTGNEGNHGEDVKEIYVYLDSTPTHSYAKMLYKYPQVEYPYLSLVEENQKRNRLEPEFELLDALRRAFDENRIFDVVVEYAKAAPEDILCRITVVNRGPDPAPVHILPQVWFRNTWSWGHNPRRPSFSEQKNSFPGLVATTSHRHLKERFWAVTPEDGRLDGASLLFTENDTNRELLYGAANETPYVKDAFHQAIVHGNEAAVNPQMQGSKVAAHIRRELGPGESTSVWVRFGEGSLPESPFTNLQETIDLRTTEADEFYRAVQDQDSTREERNIHRQAIAGLLWSKQFYHYGVELWLDGDPGAPPPPASRRDGRNSNWGHLYNLDVISMPDKWEYPWYAAWDLAFHTLPLCTVDPEWAKRQLILMVREWYMHPNGQMPAYEWSFSDVNPPVHAWAALRVYEISRAMTGVSDTTFLERIFHKLLLNFTWWVNRKDASGKNVFQGGFLGLDNIGVFNRSELPSGGELEQADGTAWMAMYCLNMLAISLELARTKPAYEDMATKFFEHFVYITNSIHEFGDHGLWDHEDGFYYDQLRLKNGSEGPMRIRSFVGLIPMFATYSIEPDLLEKLPRFRMRMEWFMKYRPRLVKGMASLTERGESGRLLLSLINRERLVRILGHMLDEEKFLSPYGLRSLSREHNENPYSITLDGTTHTVSYEPDESQTSLFGGNSNWRGPVWFPVNYLMVESLRQFHRYYGESLRVECPTRTGSEVTLGEAAAEISRRLVRLFLLDGANNRPFHGSAPNLQAILESSPEGPSPLLFYEYFNGDNGRGLGASHQTGWTALVALLASAPPE